MRRQSLAEAWAKLYGFKRLNPNLYASIASYKLFSLKYSFPWCFFVFAYKIRSLAGKLANISSYSSVLSISWMYDSSLTISFYSSMSMSSEWTLYEEFTLNTYSLEFSEMMLFESRNFWGYYFVSYDGWDFWKISFRDLLCCYLGEVSR